MVASRGTALLFCAAMTTGRVPTGLRRFLVSLPRSGRDAPLLDRATVHGEGRSARPFRPVYGQ